MKPLHDDSKISQLSAQNPTGSSGADDHPLFKDKRIISFMQKYGVDRKAILDDQTLFRSWLEQKRKCAQCIGLEYCRLKPKGAVKIPYVDETGVISARYRPCNYSFQREKDLYLKKKYIHSHMSDADYLLKTENLGLAAQSNEYLKVFTYLTEIREPKGRGGYVYGAAGSGKTTMLKVIANRMAQKGFTISFIYVPDFIQEMRARSDDKREAARLLDKLKMADVLILDDLGSEYVTQWSRDEVLLPVLDYRYNRNKLTHFSSNYDFDELVGQYTVDKRDENGIAAKRFLDRVFALAKRAYLPGLSMRHDIDLDDLPSLRLEDELD